MTGNRPKSMISKLDADAIYDISRNGYPENRAEMAERYKVSVQYICALFKASKITGVSISEPAIRGRKDRREWEQANANVG